MEAPPKTYVLFALTAVVVLIIVGAVAGHDDPARQKQQEIEKLVYSLNGPDLFRAHCAPCHGADGKGGGPVAPALKEPLPDLTTIAQRNGGIYPERRVVSIIAGDEALLGHGSRDMPIWGLVFHQVEFDRDYGNVRLHNVTEYLRTLQQK